MNRFGKHALFAFLALPVIGYVLIHAPQIQVTVSPGAAYAFSGALSSAAVGMYGMRRHRR
ncbi:hypothetical protein [Streptomyces sp. NPDC003327]